MSAWVRLKRWLHEQAAQSAEWELDKAQLELAYRQSILKDLESPRSEQEGDWT